MVVSDSLEVLAFVVVESRLGLVVLLLLEQSHSVLLSSQHLLEVLRDRLGCWVALLDGRLLYVEKILILLESLERAFALIKNIAIGCVRCIPERNPLLERRIIPAFH